MYGFAHPHVRHNMKAMVCHGLIRHAKDSRRAHARAAPGTRLRPGASAMPPGSASASAAVLDLIGHTASLPAMTSAEWAQHTESRDGWGHDCKQPSSLIATNWR